jgi:pyruvate dehydrogenase (quinone)
VPDPQQSTIIPTAPARRDFLRLTTATGAGLLAGQMLSPAISAAQTSETTSIRPQPDPMPAGVRTTGDIIVDTLIAWGVPFVFGMVGDGINGVVDALRKRQDRIRYIGVRHEEAAAFMASAYAKYTGRLGVCLATTGPGAVHLMNGLYDAKMDGAPVLAITGLTYHDLIGTRFQQDIDTIALMNDVALYNTAVTSPGHALIVSDLACRAALGNRGVAHLSVPKDVQLMQLSADHASRENHGARTSSSWLPPLDAPPQDQLRAAAAVLNAGSKVAILVGQGALNARAEVLQVADTLGAPVAKALLGRAVIPDDSPFSTGGIGHLGTLPSKQMMASCDTVLILGSTMPWIDYYPKPGQARGVQVDRNPARIGVRYPVEIGLVGDTRTTLRALIPLLQRKSDRAFLMRIQQRMRDWDSLVARVAATPRSPLRPQMVVRAVSDLLAPNAIIALDSGANTHFAARCLRIQADQKISVSGMMASMASGLPFAIAAQLAYPDRQCVAIVGDGGFAMLMAELTTAARLNLPIKVVVLKNNMLAEVSFEQREIGAPSFGCELGPIDFVQFARSCGAEGYRCANPEEVQPALRAALGSRRPAVIEAVVDPLEPPAMPDQLRV